MGSGGSQVRTWTRRSSPPVRPQIRAATAVAGYASSGARTGTRIRRNRESPSPRCTSQAGTGISRWSVVSITSASLGDRYLAGSPRPVPLLVRAGVVTTRDQSPDCPQDCPQNRRRAVVVTADLDE